MIDNRRYLSGNKYTLMVILALFLFSCTKKKQRPNVVIIYTDDIGYGDIGVNGAKLIPTPNIDKLASEGILFTDAHCAASTCSPSRYALLTGEMGFRKNLGIQSVNAPATIHPTQFTLGTLFQKAGYKTGIVGKWHLGLGNGDIDWNKKLSPVLLKSVLIIVSLFLLPTTGPHLFTLKITVSIILILTIR